MKSKLKLGLILASLLITMTGCTWWNDRVKNFESDTSGLKRTIYVYSYTGELLKTYQGENVRLESGSTGTILQLDGKRITISNAIVVTEEE